MEVPPFHSYLGIELVRQEAGQAEVAIDLAPHHLNRRGVAHGGLIAALLDSALGAAVISSMPQEWWCTTTSLATQFIEGAGAGRLIASGRVLRRGLRVAFAAGEVRDLQGRVIATAAGTWHLWSTRPEPRLAVEGFVSSLRTGERVRVGKIIAVGRNYADHVAEMDADTERPPVIFLKPVSALLHHEGVLRLPPAAGQVHHEVELVVVIGRAGRSISREQALDHVLGYAVGLDMTLRDLQAEAKKRGEPWTLSKGFDGAAPVSPFVPREEVGDGSGLEITLDVNGRRVQQGNTSQMLHDVPGLIGFVSRWMTLERGDLLFTGTPAGVGPVAPGDRLEASLDRVGTLHVSVEADTA